MKIKDLMPGMRFNKLTLVEPRDMDERRETLWLCRCDCGNEVVLVASRVKAGKVKSCGCARQVFGKHIGALRKKEGGWMPKVLPEGVKPRLIPYIPKDISQFGYDSWMFRSL